MDLKQMQHAVDLIATSNPSAIQGNQNVIQASQNVLSVTGAIQSLAANLSKRGLSTVDSLFEAYDEANPVEESDQEESGD